MNTTDNTPPPRGEGLYLRLTCCGRMLHLRHLVTVPINGRPHVTSADVIEAVQWHRADCDP